MAQIIKFFGWLLFFVGVTLFIFGHVSMMFVYGWTYVAQAIWPKSGTLSSLWALPIAMAPGMLLLGLAKVMAYFGGNEDEEEEQDEGAEPAPTPPLNPPTLKQP